MCNHYKFCLLLLVKLLLEFFNKSEIIVKNKNSVISTN